MLKRQNIPEDSDMVVESMQPESKRARGLSSSEKKEHSSQDTLLSSLTLGQRLLMKAGWKGPESLESSNKEAFVVLAETESINRVGLGFDAANLDVTPQRHEFDVNRVIEHEQSPSWLENGDDTCVDLNQSFPGLCFQLIPNDPSTKHPPLFGTSQAIAAAFEEHLNWRVKFGPVKRQAFAAARRRSNPYELASKSIFLNRAAVKLASIDKFIPLIPEHASGKLFFADICGGPGGFSEYLLWRYHKTFDIQGFVNTYVPEAPFKFKVFHPQADSSKLQLCLGKDETGNLLDRDNIMHIAEMINQGTQNIGVSLVVADGALGVEEDHSKARSLVNNYLILAEVMVILEVLAKGGTCVLKLFDTFFPLMNNLIYIMYRHFDRISIFKPFSSRISSTESYLICQGFRYRRPAAILQHLYIVYDHLNGYALKTSSSLNKLQMDCFILESEMLLNDSKFMDYMNHTTETLSVAQNQALNELFKYLQDPRLPSHDQRSLRDRCLTYWNLPLDLRSPRKAANASLLKGAGYRNVSKPDSTEQAYNDLQFHYDSPPPITIRYHESYRHLYGTTVRKTTSLYYEPINNGSAARIRIRPQRKTATATIIPPMDCETTETSSNRHHAFLSSESSTIHERCDLFERTPRHLIKTSNGSTLYPLTFMMTTTPNMEEHHSIQKQSTDEDDIKECRDYFRKLGGGIPISDKELHVLIAGSWRHRFELFHNFAAGIQCHKESWFSAIPESIIQHIAEQTPGETVVDAFCGSGNHAIQFALKGKRVIAFDMDPMKLEMAHHNAKIHGVAHLIQFILGDFMLYASYYSLHADMIFLNPPQDRVISKTAHLDLSNLCSLDGFRIFEAAKNITENIVFYLPPNVKLEHISLLACHQISYLERNYSETHKCIGLTIYLGRRFVKHFRDKIESRI